MLRTRPPDNQHRANVACRRGSQLAYNRQLLRFKPRADASCLAMVNPLPSSFVRLLFLLFLAEFPARNPRSKVPKPVEHCQCGAQREQGEQYIDRRRRAVQWTERFAPKSAPITNSVEIWRVCALRRCLPLNWAILRFMVKEIGRCDCAAFSKAGLFAIQNGARG